MIMNLSYPVLWVSRYTMALFFGSYHVTPCRHHRWLLFEGTDLFKLTHLPAEIERWKRRIDTAGDRTMFSFNVTFRMSPSGKKQPDAFAITTLNSPLWTFQEGFQVGTALKWPQAFLHFSKPLPKPISHIRFSFIQWILFASELVQLGYWAWFPFSHTQFHEQVFPVLVSTNLCKRCYQFSASWWCFDLHWFSRFVFGPRRGVQSSVHRPDYTWKLLIAPFCWYKKRNLICNRRSCCWRTLLFNCWDLTHRGFWESMPFLLKAAQEETWMWFESPLARSLFQMISALVLGQAPTRGWWC